MIQKIGTNFGIKNTVNTGLNKTQNPASPSPSENSEQEKAKPSPSLLHSYFVSFGASELDKTKKTAKADIDDMATLSKMVQNKMTPDAKDLYETSTQLAKEYGHKKINQLHILRVGLEYTKEYIDGLNSGDITYGDPFYTAIPSIFEEELGEKVLKDKVRRNRILPIIKKEINILDKKLAASAPSNENPQAKTKITFSDDLLNDVYSLYQQDNGPTSEGDHLIHDETIFDAALFSHNTKFLSDVSIPFMDNMKEAVFVDNRPLNERVHLEFYDDKAKNIWKNLSTGTNMSLIHDKDTKSEYMINSILKQLDSNPKGFGRLNKNNTKVTVFNEDNNIMYLLSFLKKAAKDPKTNYVLIFDSNKTIRNSLPEEALINITETTPVAMTAQTADILLTAPPNVQYITVSDKDNYYNQINMAGSKTFFADFGEMSIPIINTAEAKKMFKNEPQLMEKVKKPFTQQAMEKAIEASNQLSGAYPEKAIKVMNLISSYYIDKKKEINLVDVQNYIKEAKDVFKQTENESSIKVLLETNIKLKDMVGSPSTKKEAQSIVDRVKDKTIGTKGFVIYSQDGSVGAGRKYTAQAIAGEAKSPYIEINAVDFGTKDVDLFGGGNLSPEASMKKLFGMVKAQAETNPKKSAVMFIENFEYFSYGEHLSEYHEKAMSQLIREMNKAQEQGMNIVVMGSMSNPKYIGEATTKSFKFIDKIEVESPGYNKDARNEIVNYYLKKKNIKLSGDDNEQKKIKEHINLLMERASYIEILTLMDKAKNVSKERKHKDIEKGDFTEAYLQLTTGRPSSAQDPYYRKEMVTSHECGHALNATIMEELAEKEGNPSHKGTVVNFITLDPRGYFGGAVFTADSINPEYSFEHTFSDLVCDFGGNSCEKHFFGQDGSWGITCDMQMATHGATMATAMMGQGKHFGKKSIDGMWVISEKDKDNMNKDIDVMLKNSQLISDAITEVYADFNKNFVKKYAPKVGTGECIVQREEFLEMLNEWRAKQSPEKQEEFKLLDKTILEVISATKRGVKCHKEGEK